MATHSSILAWRRIPRTEEPGGLQSTGSQESYMTERLHFTSAEKLVQHLIILLLNRHPMTLEEIGS